MKWKTFISLIAQHYHHQAEDFISAQVQTLCPSGGSSGGVAACVKKTHLWLRFPMTNADFIDIFLLLCTLERWC